MNLQMAERLNELLKETNNKVTLHVYMLPDKDAFEFRIIHKPPLGEVELFIVEIPHVND